MKKRNFLLMAVLFAAAIIAVQCKDDETFVQTPEMTLKKGRPVPGTEASNNLSFPVIWAEGVTKVLPGTAGMTPQTEGVWWWWWGTEGVDPNIVPLSCPPDPDDPNYCDDGISGQATGAAVPQDDPDLVKAFLQKDAKNVWQAGTLNWPTEFVGVPLNVNWIDWGDNLESGDWYTRSQVRTEVVLFQDLGTQMLEYQMRHTSGWGIDEVHGLATDLAKPPVPLLGVGNQATVYSHCARLTIQKLLVTRGDGRLNSLIWKSGLGWTEPGEITDNLINDPIFNSSVNEGGYSAEINVKGRIIYGYTWNVRTLNDDTPVEGSETRTPAGDYRITFSLDPTYNNTGGVLNTFFVNGITNIILPLEVEIAAALAEIEAEESGDEGGGTGVLDFNNNLTYIDVRILERSGGGGGGRK